MIIEAAESGVVSATAAQGDSRLGHLAYRIQSFDVSYKYHEPLLTNAGEKTIYTYRM